MSALTITCVPQVLAQDSGTLLRQQQEQQKIQPIESLPEQEEKLPVAPDVPPETGETIIIKNVLFTGRVDLLTENSHKKMTNESIGKRVGINGLLAMSDQITVTLQKQGHLLASAILPAQNISEGVVTFEIIDGHLSKINVNPITQNDESLIEVLFPNIDIHQNTKVRVKESQLQNIVASRITLDAVTKSSLEDALLRLNEHPGLNAKARLSAGQEVNSSVLGIDIKQAPIFSSFLSVDNSGSYSTGHEQLKVGATFTDITGYGDLTQFVVIASQGQTFSYGAFSMPLGVSDFTAQANYNYLDYQNIDETGKILGLEGYAHFTEVGLDYSILRGRDVNFSLSNRLNKKVMVDDSIAGRLQRKNALTAIIELTGNTHDSLMGGGVTYWSTGWTYGEIELSDEDSASTSEASGLKINGKFQRINYDVTRLQKLPHSFSLLARIYGQWANKNLDSSEDFSLGGPYGVRGWAIGEGRGDLGIISTIELRYQALRSTPFGGIQLATFYDIGHVQVNKNVNGVASIIACGCNAYELDSVGVSALWSQPSFTISALLAKGLGANPGRSLSTGMNADNTNNNHQLWLTATAKF